MSVPELPVITLLGPQGEQRLHCASGLTLRDVLAASGVALRSSCGGNALCGQCRVRILEGAPPPPSEGERRQLQAAQLEWGERLACQVIPHSSLRVAVVEDRAESEWRPLRDDEYFPAAAASGDVTPSSRPIGDSSRYGVAVDLGTTHIRITLWDLQQGRRLAGRAGHNPQGAFGADILTRLAEAAHSPASAQLLRQVAAQAIGKALAELAQSAGFALAEIDNVQIVGNTAMLALLAGKNPTLLLDPDYWTRPIDIQPTDPHFLPSTWGLGDAATVHLVPALGGFVGSDLLAGVLATRLTEGPANTLLIDFGTNSEIALWDGKTLHVTSSAGGPAFEGSGIDCGMPGDQGAIYRIQENQQPSSIQLACSVLGGGTAHGICGSGLVDAIACLRRCERLDRLGRLRLPDGATAISLAPDAPELSISNKDIDVFQRAKAAIAGGVRWLCHEAGVPLSQLQRVYACGAFGRLLDIDNAQTIGLLPAIATDRIQLGANSALAGCEALLLKPDGEAHLASWQAQTRLYNMAESETFEALFVDSLYIQPMES